MNYSLIAILLTNSKTLIKNGDAPNIDSFKLFSFAMIHALKTTIRNTVPIQTPVPVALINKWSYFMRLYTC